MLPQGAGAPFAFKDSMIHPVVQFILHFAVTRIDSRTKRFTNESRLSLPDIQTQLNFEIANGQQNSLTAESKLIQRRLASTLKWPHYMFTSSEIPLSFSERYN